MLFTEGRALAKGGHYAEARVKFAQSLDFQAGTGTEFNLADCWEHLAEPERARALFLDVAEKAHAAGQADRERIARERAAALAPRPDAEPPQLAASVPELVISGQAPREPPATNPQRSGPPSPEALSAELVNESGSLAEAALELKRIEQSAAALVRSAPEDRKLRKLAHEIALLKKALDEDWQLAGRAELALHAKRTASERPAAGRPSAAAPPVSADAALRSAAR